MLGIYFLRCSITNTENRNRMIVAQKVTFLYMEQVFNLSFSINDVNTAVMSVRSRETKAFFNNPVKES